ncbi:hypothetical protein PW5551_00720 [Petrotoga sp. 9PW.55.5.1]|uniref:polyprenyl synthetase family protein n=1 Tax=Petrotoga sp. 9PW.55.5.1 TaxID=1308979 RepID=UPI000DC48BB8|nr:polyprenyl synthetase family protein [Petrotoga sp. 9PW.55.5.1]RAO99941.1 hypothetical protein PW5551_00720 [Petrotoga sp. 9PW.55.5.1]
MELDEFKKVFDREIDIFFTNAEVEKELKDAILYSIKSGGKRIRPWIIFNLGNALFLNDSDLLNIGIAVEILHSSSLIHDDLPALDNADLRRGALSNHKKFGEYSAILAGDYGFTLPIKIFIEYLDDVSTDRKMLLIKYFVESTLKLFEGELKDLDFEKKNIRVTKEEILNMYSKKTGALFGFCFAAPFLLSGSIKTGEKMKEIGIKFGIAFQIYDDLKDLTGTEKELGKDINKDINKKTLLNYYKFKEAKNIADKYYEEVLKELYQSELEELMIMLGKIKAIIETK